MSVIKINCIDQVLQFTNTPVIAAGGVREDHVEFTFCRQWDGFEKVAVFLKNTEMLPPELIDADGRCEIPYDVLASAGRFYIGVFGVNAEGVRRTSEYLEYKIVEGAIASVGEPEEPDIFERMLQAAAGKQNALVWDEVPTESSRNAVSSDAVYKALQERVPTTRKVNNKALSSDLSLEASDFTLNTLVSNVSFAALAGSPTATLRHNHFVDACFLRLYCLVVGSDFKKGEWQDVAVVPEGYRPTYIHPLTISCAVGTSARINTSGVIQIRVNESVPSTTADYLLYIGGFWMV